MNAVVRKYFLYVLTTVLGGFFTSPVKADERFTASASSTTVAVGEQIQITFRLQGGGRNFQAPTFAGFNVLMGPSQSSQMQIINGSVSQSISYTYVIQAINPGTFKIGAASIETEGQRIQSNELTITVNKGSNNPQAQGQQKSGGSNDATAGDKNVFIKATIDKSNVYRGEAVVVTYKLYTRLSLVNFSLKKAPSFEGFFSYDIDIPQQPEFRTENIDGVQYKAAEIKKVVLFPQRTGTLTVDPMEAEVVARVQAKRQQTRDPFDPFNDPFFNQLFGNAVQDIPVKLKSDPVKIQVRDLPAGAPPSFNGAVGKYSVSVALDKKETKAHDAITLKLKITGKGSIKLIDPPKIEFPPDFETYDPKITSNATASTAGVSGSKSFEYLLIPRNPGEYKITVSDFSFFDLDKKKYEIIPGSEFILKVGKGDETATTTTTITGVSKNDIQFLGKDIRFIKTNAPVFVAGTELFYGSVLFYLLLALPVFLFIVLFIFRKRYLEMQSNVTLLKSRKANKVAKKRLSTAKKFLAENKPDAFLDEMFRALWGFVSDRLQIPVSALSKDNVAAALTAKSVSENTVSLFIQTLDACEMARFAKGIAASNEDIYKKGIDVISKLEEEIK